jgi:sugar lactone lactonase YvrE
MIKDFFYTNIIKASILFGVLCLPIILPAQIITTIVGDGRGTFGGDGGFASKASLSTPNGIVLDKIGNIYISDSKGSKIRKVNTSGIISTIAGWGSAGMSGDGGPATAAKLNFPSGILIDNFGNIIFSDSYNHRIRKIDSAGIITTIVGTGIGGYTSDDTLAIHSRLNIPCGLALDDEGNLYIADRMNHRIRKVNTSGVITTVAGNGLGTTKGDGGPATAASINRPNDVKISPDGALIIADTYGNAVRKIKADGIIKSIAGVGDGFSGFGGDEGVIGESRLASPYSLAIDNTGNIYVADKNNNRIRRIDVTGAIKTVAGNGASVSGGDGRVAVDASISSPESIAVDEVGNLYIGETSKIRYLYLKDYKNEAKISFMPNPCLKSTTIFLSSMYGEMVTISIYNTQGQLMSTTEGPTNRNITLEFVSAGTYRVVAISKHGKWSGSVVVLQ